MVFGNPQDFAIEAVSDAGPASPIGTVWGHMRLWCRGLSIGDFDERHSGLSHAQASLTELCGALDALESASLSLLDDQAAWEFLERKLYVDDARSDAQVAGDATWWRRFAFLTNWGEPFDGYAGFIFRQSPASLRIVARCPDNEMVGLTVTVSAFREAVEAFEHWCVERVANGSSRVV
jgi:hypothetical protein